MSGVANKLLYWGFDKNGQVLEQPQSLSGGYTFRGDVFDDPNVPRLWTALNEAVRKKGIEVVVEEAAYTWFNRMMALMILAKNGYIESLLDYAEGMEHTPLMLQRARQGRFEYLTKNEQQRLGKLIGDYNKDQDSFALLLIGYCHHNQTIKTVFGKVDDYTELLLPDNMLQDGGFLHLLNSTDAISDEDYHKVELIGWLYQFYISERKDEVFASFGKGKKAEAKDIPAATQIFTPNWIVKYMVENTAGKIWLDKHPNSPLKGNMKYLVENESDGQSEPIISNVEELTLMDPACGSGHILVEGFDLLYQMYMEEYYTPEEAVESILKNNLYGLDIDDRAAQLATFAILLKAAKHYRDIWSKGWLPNVYAMPEAKDFARQDLKDFLGPEGDAYIHELFDALFLMKQAKNLGSVMKLKLSKAAQDFIARRFSELKDAKFRDFNVEAVYQSIQSYIPVLLLLTKKYASVIANPPYMGQKSMNSDLKNYVNTNYPMTKSDLMTIFMEVIPNMTSAHSRFALINLPSWLFLSSFEKLRELYLVNFSFDSLLHMGRGIFGIDFGSVAFAVRKLKDENPIGSYFRLHERNFQHIYYSDIEKLFLYSNGAKGYKYDFKQYRDDEGVNEIPENGTEEGLQLFYPNIPQTNFAKIPGSPIAYWVSKKVIELFEKDVQLNSKYQLRKGLSTGENNRFIRAWQEVDISRINFNCTTRDDSNNSTKWYPCNKGGDSRKWYGNQEYLINWQYNGKELLEMQPKSVIRSPSNYFKKNIVWSKVSSKGITFRFFPEGFVPTDAISYILTENDSEQLIGYLNSKVYVYLISILSPTLNFETGQVGAIPFRLLTEENHGLACIEISKKDWDSRETSWDFEQSPLLNDTPSLEISYAKWQEKISQDFFQLHANEEELNRIFIDIYGLQDELTPEVPLKDITILQEELDRKQLEALEPVFRTQGKDAIELPIDKGEVISQFISYAIGLFMGRYRLDKPGLNIAHPNPTAEELASYTYNGGQVTIDEDAIIPLMGARCNFPDDALNQINVLLDVIWGQDTHTQNINFIQECLDKDLEKFLVKDFYKYHCDMYKKKPIYWLFSSKKGAFQVLVYMHRMNEFTAEKIRANYLLEHIKNLRSEEAMLAANESNLSTQEARKLEQIRKDLHDCEEYDMELKNVADQQIKFDLDDGVTANYKLFESVVAKIK
jgi:type II restriction/modification system DNA methylase subunit YeeA